MSGPAAIVLGLDGATLDLLIPWAEAGALPNLKALMDRGAIGKLRSTLPFVTALAWPSIYTGVNPGKHGLMAFRHRAPDEYRWTLNSYNDLQYPPMWDVMGDQGLRTASLFVPLTFPARTTNGVVVSGAFGPGGFERGTVHPESLGTELSGRYSESSLFGIRRDPDVPLSVIAERMVRGVHDQTDVMCDVLRGDSFDFVFLVWHDTDKAAHLFWHHSELPCPDLDSPIANVYKAVDEGIGRVLEAAGGDPLVIVCSDHGTYPIRYRVQTHIWLWQEGFLGVTALAQTAAKVGGTWRRLPKGLRSVVPQSIRRRVYESLGEKKQYDLTRKRSVGQNEPLPHIEWSSTTAFAAPDTAEAMWANVAGRDPQGIVSPEQKEEVLRSLEQRLMALHAPDGERLVERVWRREELYDGPWSHLGSDIVVDPFIGTMFAPSIKRLRNPAIAEVITTPTKPDLATDRSKPLGYHQRDGVVIFSGGGVQQGALPLKDVTEIAPTIYRALGVSMPDDLDGVGIEEAFSELPETRLFERRAEISREGDGLTESQVQEISKHLQELGYIE